MQDDKNVKEGRLVLFGALGVEISGPNVEKYSKFEQTPT